VAPARCHFNIFIGEWPRTGVAGRIDFSAMDAKARALLDEIGFLEFLDPQRAGLQLSPAQKHNPDCVTTTSAKR
jgi:ABC-type sugar transport system ATPase subunit